jgi:hypothetical protein
MSTLGSAEIGGQNEQKPPVQLLQIDLSKGLAKYADRSVSYFPWGPLGCGYRMNYGEYWRLTNNPVSKATGFFIGLFIAIKISDNSFVGLINLLVVYLCVYGLIEYLRRGVAVRAGEVIRVPPLPLHVWEREFAREMGVGTTLITLTVFTFAIAFGLAAQFFVPQSGSVGQIICAVAFPIAIWLRRLYLLAKNYPRPKIAYPTPPPVIKAA